MNWGCDWICGTNGKIELFSDDEFSYNIYQNKVDGQYIQQFLLVKTLRITRVVLYSLTFSSLSEAIKFAEEDNMITDKQSQSQENLALRCTSKYEEDMVCAIGEDYGFSITRRTAPVSYAIFHLDFLHDYTKERWITYEFSRGDAKITTVSNLIAILEKCKCGKFVEDEWSATRYTSDMVKLTFSEELDEGESLLLTKEQLLKLLQLVD